MNYDILILPTIYHGEGFPGSIIDTYMAGIPEIVNNWMEISSFVNQGVTGYLIDNNCVKDYANVIKDLHANPQKLKSLKLNARQEFENKYHHDNIWKALNGVCKFNKLN